MRQQTTAATRHPATASVATPAPKRQSPGPAAEPAAKRQRTEPAPFRAQPGPARNEIDQLHVKLRELDALMKQSAQEKYRLDVAVVMAETEAELDAAEAARDAFRPSQAKLIAAKKDVQARIAFIADPRPHASVQRLMQLGRSNGPRDSGGQRDIIRGNIDALRRDGDLLERRDELRAAQQQVRKLLASGTLDGLPKGELQELRALATLDIDRKLGALHDLKATVAHTERQLKAMGAGGLFQGRTMTAKERAAWQAEELLKAQQALDNGY